MGQKAEVAFYYFILSFVYAVTLISDLSRPLRMLNAVSVSLLPVS